MLAANELAISGKVRNSLIAGSSAVSQRLRTMWWRRRGRTLKCNGQVISSAAEPTASQVSGVQERPPHWHATCAAAAASRLPVPGYRLKKHLSHPIQGWLLCRPHAHGLDSGCWCGVDYSWITAN